jgi:hypothetical protein
MNFSPKEFIYITENIIKKITHDLSNPMSAIINACEIFRFQNSKESDQGDKKLNLNSIFQNASNSLHKKINLIRYLFISYENISLNHDDEIFFEIVQEFESKNSFNLNFDFENSEILFKKILIFCLSSFSYFILKNSIINFYKEDNSKGFFFEFEFNSCSLKEIESIIKFLHNDLNFEKDKDFLNPIEVFTFYFKIFLKDENLLIKRELKDKNKILVKFLEKS